MFDTQIRPTRTVHAVGREDAYACDASRGDVGPRALPLCMLVATPDRVVLRGTCVAREGGRCVRRVTSSALVLSTSGSTPRTHSKGLRSTHGTALRMAQEDVDAKYGANVLEGTTFALDQDGCDGPMRLMSLEFGALESALERHPWMAVGGRR